MKNFLILKNDHTESCLRLGLILFFIYFPPFFLIIFSLPWQDIMLFCLPFSSYSNLQLFFGGFARKKSSIYVSLVVMTVSICILIHLRVSMCLMVIILVGNSEKTELF